MSEDPVSLFWGLGIDLELTKALSNALVQADKAAAANGRLITQVSHTVTLMPGGHPTVQAGFRFMHNRTTPEEGRDYTVVTVTATTISRP